MKCINVIHIVGLPGSGKTTLGKTLAMEPKSLFLDDFLFDVDGSVSAFRSSGCDNLILTDPRLCPISKQDIISRTIKCFGLDGDENFIFHYFQNDPEACIINAQREPKPNGGTENFIRMVSKRYTVPADTVVHEVYK